METGPRSVELPTITQEELASLPSRTLTDAEWNRLFTTDEQGNFPGNELLPPYERNTNFHLKDVGEGIFEVYDKDGTGLGGRFSLES